MVKRIALFLKTDLGIALCIAVGWQLLFTGLGWLLAPQQGLLGHMNHWDAGWYQHVIADAYSTQGSPAAPAFYPLFPLAVSALTTIGFGFIGQDLAALLIDTVSLWLIVAALFKITSKFKASRFTQYIAVAAFLSFPSAFFLHVFYSEALFIAVAFWAYWWALEKKWRYVGMLLAVLTAARLPSLLFVALCGLEYLRAYHWDIKRALNKNILWFLLAPIGFILYGVYLLIVRGDFLAMFHAYHTTSDWTYQTFNPNIFATLYDAAKTAIQSALTLHPTYDAFINYALPLMCILLLLACSIYLLKTLKSHGVPLFIFGMLSIILFTVNSNVVSVHRYVLACLPIFIAFALLARKKTWRYLIIGLCIVGLCVQLFIYAKFVHGIFAG